MKTTLLTLGALLLSYSASSADLIAWYPFDDPANPLTDESGNGNDLEDGISDPEYESTGGIEGGAFVFDGGQRLIAPIDINPFEIEELTIGAWVKPSVLNPALRKVIGQDDGGWDRTIGLDNRNGGFRYTSFVGNRRPVVDLPGPENTDDWTFLAVVFDEPNGEVTVYVDLDAGTIGDELVSMTEDTVFNPGQDTTSIGSLRPDNNNEGWVGAIDGVFFFNSLLTEAEVSKLRDDRTPIALPPGDPELSLGELPDLSMIPLDPAVAQFSIDVENTGAAETLIISEIKVSGAEGERFSVAAFPDQLAAGGATGVIDMAFDPLGQVGTFDALLEIVSNDSNRPSRFVGISATTVARVPADPVMMITPSPAFGILGVDPGTVVRTLTVANSGAGQPLRVFSGSISGEDAANYTLGTLPEMVAAGANATIEVTFDPKGIRGVFRASLELNTTDSSGRFTTVDLGAEVERPAAELPLIAHYTFDDENDPLRDDSSNGNDLTPAGSEPVYDPSSGLNDTGGFEFDGSSRFIAPIDINPSEIPELTVGAFVKTLEPDSPALRKVLGQDNGGWDRTIGLDNREGDYRYTSFVGNRRPVVDTPGPENDEDWTFLGVVYDEPNSEVTVYVDLDVSSIDDELVAVTEDTAFNPGQPEISIGSLRPDNNGEGWVGFIDEVFLIEGVLTPSEMTKIRDDGGVGGGTGGGPGFRITSISIGEDGMVTFSWDGARSNDTFIIESSTDLQLWEELTDGFEELTITLPVPEGVEEIYYRVGTEP
jgi:hypothetical protein